MDWLTSTGNPQAVSGALSLSLQDIVNAYEALQDSWFPAQAYTWGGNGVAGILNFVS